MQQRYIERETTKTPSVTGKEALIFGISGEDKIEQFEKILEGSIDVSDTVNAALEKVVKAALCVEFGEKILKHKQSKKMVSTLVMGIMQDSELRKQALIILDRYSKSGELNA